MRRIVSVEASSLRFSLDSKYNQALLHFPRDHADGSRRRRRRRRQSKGGKRWDPFTRVDFAHELYTERYSMSGTKFTRSGRTDRSNATIIGAELLDLAERRVSKRTKWSRNDSSRPVAL
ncbi:unnamed protein product [Lasius platythorax]|uniref:Uncharacterized protein n=1 Tax=Lasius platythorax TaxID=488582 RepID=A0AAV2NKJ7_9HYME